MIYEFRKYDLKPRTLAQYDSTVEKALAGGRPDYSPLFGYWYSEFGQRVAPGNSGLPTPLRFCLPLLGPSRVGDESSCTSDSDNIRRYWITGHLTHPESDVLMTEDGRFVRIETPYRVRVELLKAWIEFLRECGGFEVC